jgi:FAD/FMN-containing dehydrogenase
VPASLVRGYEYVEAWGMADGAYGDVLRPRDAAGVAEALAHARATGRSIGLRGTGCSYGDASLNDGGLTLDLTRMNRVLSFDAEAGIAEVEPGVTIEQLWKHALPLGYWPRVVSGTMFPTIGGALAMNIHGKNDYAVGTIGDATVAFDIALPSGELRTCSRERNADLFHAAIGGFGMLGVLTRVELRLTRVHSGELEQRAFANRDLGEMLAYIEDRRTEADYLVGWVDAFPGGDALGRGLVHEARYLEPGEDPEPERTLKVEHQLLPSSVLGFPKSELWWLMRLLFNDRGMRLVNAGKYWSGRIEAMGPPSRIPHAAFAFLLDFVPNWKWGYGRRPGRGLIQYQTFLPKETALETYRELLERNHRAGFTPYLGVVKRHRPDPFWLTHAVDGWSFAMDFAVTPENRAALFAHCAELTEVVLAAGGRFYFAKDSVLHPGDPERMFEPARLAAFLDLKRELDPDGLLQTNLWRRLFAPGDDAR